MKQFAPFGPYRITFYKHKVNGDSSFCFTDLEDSGSENPVQSAQKLTQVANKRQPIKNVSNRTCFVIIDTNHPLPPAIMLDQIRQTIRDELDTMRTAGARRQELSLHACKRLFFDLGIRPSAANVRDLTQTGSASDIPKDIDHFWERIRAASKIRLEGAAIPKPVEEKAAALLGALYEEALKQARHSFEIEHQQASNEITAVEQKYRDALIRQESLEAALSRSDARADHLQNKLTEIEIKLASASTEEATRRDSSQDLIRRLENENALLSRRIESEQAQNAALRERIDALHTELRENTEHYARQIKDAVAEAERRVKPMLVELDSLRSMASTYQQGLRDVNRKEFDFLQQLSAAKARADRLDEQLREQSDDLAEAIKEVEILRASQGITPELAALIQRLADAGQLDTAAFDAIGTSLDQHVTLPARCPKCGHGEPELSHSTDGYELFCPDCEHTSDAQPSRFAAATHFFRSR